MEVELDAIAALFHEEASSIGEGPQLDEVAPPPLAVSAAEEAVTQFVGQPVEEPAPNAPLRHVEAARVWWTRLGARRVLHTAPTPHRYAPQESDVFAALFAQGGPLEHRTEVQDPFAAAFDRGAHSTSYGTADLDEFTAWIKGAGKI